MAVPTPAAGVASALNQIAYVFLWAFVFCLPWEEAFPLLGGFLIGRWIGLLAFGIVIFRVATTAQVRRLSPLHYWMLALVGWAALSALWTLDWDSTAMRIGTYLQLLAAVWLIWELAVTESRVLRLLEAYVLGTYVSSIGAISNFIMGRTAAQLAATMGKNVWETSRYTMYGFNENDLGLMLALSIPMTLYLLASRRGSLLTLLYWFQLAVSTVAILLTGSRGALLAAIVALLMVPLTMSQLPRWRLWQRLAAVGACVGVIACGMYFVPQSSWERLLQIWTEFTEGTLTHRTVIWSAGLEAFRDHPFLGVGAGAYGPTVLKALDIAYVSHNTFLSVLVELGVVGALLLFGLLAGLLYRSSQMPALEKRLWFVLLLTWMVGVSALTWEYRKPTWLLFGMLAAHAYAHRVEKLRARAFTRPVAQISRGLEWR